MSAGDIRTWIVQTLGRVDDVGRVHAYERHANDDRALERLYQVEADGPLLGWFVRRVSFTGERIGRAGNWRVRTVWLIRGYMALDDAASSELTLDALMDRMAQRFRVALRKAEEAKLLAPALVASEPPPQPGDGLELQNAEPVMFAGVLCHSARLSLTTIHYETEEGEG